MTKTTLDELIDLCIQAERADGKVVPILPETFFTTVAFALSKYKDMLEDGLSLDKAETRDECTYCGDPRSEHDEKGNKRLREEFPDGYHWCVGFMEKINGKN